MRTDEAVQEKRRVRLPVAPAELAAAAAADAPRAALAAAAAAEEALGVPAQTNKQLDSLPRTCWSGLPAFFATAVGYAQQQKSAIRQAQKLKELHAFMWLSPDISKHCSDFPFGALPAGRLNGP